MCAALTDNKPYDFCVAYRARFSCAIIHAEMILEFAAAIDPVNGCAVAADAFLQYGTDRFMQRLSLFRRYRIGCGDWMQFRDVQCLVGVDIAQPGEKRLVEEQWLKLAVLFMQCGVKPLWRKALAQRFGSEFAEYFFRI